MKTESCQPLTVFKQQTVSNKKLTEKHGDYTAKSGDRDYTLPQDYQGDSKCAPTAY